MSHLLPPNCVFPETLSDVLKDGQLRTLFRKFLKDRLALENLLFYQSILLYEQIEEEKAHLREKAGKFLVKQFVEEESEDCINISSVLRKTLTTTESFLAETFSKAKSEVFSLMSSNFLDNFKRHLNGTSKDAPPDFSFENMSVIYGEDFSLDSLDDFFSKVANREKSDSNVCTGCGKSHKTAKNASSLLSRSSVVSSSNGHNGRLYCCEQGRLRGKLDKMKKKGVISQFVRKMTPSGLRRQTKSKNTEIKKRGSTVRSMSLWRELDFEQMLNYDV